MAYELGVIGAGNMAEAIIRGLLAGGVMSRQQIIASDSAAARRDELSLAVGIDCTEDNSIPAGCATVLLAVKPQVMPQVLDEIAPALASDALVISIAAGVATTTIGEHLGGKGRIVRVMPNTPMLVGAGISAICAGSRASTEHIDRAAELFAAGGQTVLVDEDQMDAVTAVSGSGPAYFFYLVEAMIAAGAAEHLSADVAARLAVQTCLGAGKMLLETQEKPESLRARVTSPGGTTQRAIETMEAAKVKEALIAAIRSAAERSRQLSR